MHWSTLPCRAGIALSRNCHRPGDQRADQSYSRHVGLCRPRRRHDGYRQEAVRSRCCSTSRAYGPITYFTKYQDGLRSREMGDGPTRAAACREVRREFEVGGPNSRRLCACTLSRTVRRDHAGPASSSRTAPAAVALRRRAPGTADPKPTRVARRLRRPERRGGRHARPLQYVPVPIGGVAQGPSDEFALMLQLPPAGEQTSERGVQRASHSATAGSRTSGRGATSPDGVSSACPLRPLRP